MHRQYTARCSLCDDSTCTVRPRWSSAIPRGTCHKSQEKDAPIHFLANATKDKADCNMSKPSTNKSKSFPAKQQAMPNQTNSRPGSGLLKKLQNSIRVFPGEVARTIDESRRGVKNSRLRRPSIARNAGDDRCAYFPTTRRARRRDDRIGSELVVPSSDDTSLASDISDDESVKSPHDSFYSRSLKSHLSSNELLVSFHCDSKEREDGEELSQSSFSLALEASFPTIGATVFYENIQDMEKDESNLKKCRAPFDDETGRNMTHLEEGKKSSTGGVQYFPSSYPQSSVGSVAAAAADIKAVMGRGSRFRKKSHCRQNTRNTQKDVEDFLRFCENNYSFADEEDGSARTGEEQTT